MKNVGIKNMIFIVSILILCLVCFSKRNGEWNSVEIENYYKWWKFEKINECWKFIV